MNTYLLPMLLLLTSTAFAAPSYDCAKAHSKSELAICQSASLSDLDAALATAYKLALQASEDADSIRRTQRIWLKEARDFCEDNACLQLVMEERIAQLTPEEIVPPADQSTPSFNEEAPLAKTASSPVAQNTMPDPAVDKLEKTGGASAPVEASAGSRPFFSDITIFVMAISILAGMFAGAIGAKKHATYFASWLDFIVSTGGTLLMLDYIPNVFVWLAIVAFCHFIIGLMINDFNFKRGLISSIGRSAGVFVFLGMIAAAILWAFSKSKSSSVNSRISSGEDPLRAVENDRKAQNRANLGIAVGVGATGTAFYWIDAHFIDNMNKE